MNAELCFFIMSERNKQAEICLVCELYSSGILHGIVW
jgi:hypothetical protein